MTTPFARCALVLRHACLALVSFASLAAAQTADDYFAPSVGGEVRALAVLADGAVLLGGDFDSVDAQPQRNLARLKTGGALDGALPLDADGPVDAVLVQADGKVLLGGRFQQVNGATHRRLARLNADGSLDGGFVADADGAVAAFATQADGKILVGGDFTQIGGQPRARLARLNADGSLDAGFQADVDATVRALALQRDGGIVLGGAFTQVGGQPRAYLARVGSDGALDAAFAPAPDAPVRLLQWLPDDGLAVGGDFGQIGGAARRHLARLNHDGSLDAGYADLQGDFVPGALALQPDGRLLVVGDGSWQQAGTTRTRIARFAVDGSLDASLRGDAAPDAAVVAIALQSDGKLLLGGAFGQVGGEARAGVARLHVDGALEKAVVTAADELVRTIVAQPDGKTLLGGNFGTIQGVPRLGLARLNADGSLDAGFVADADGLEVQAIALESDGHVLVGGLFSGISGVNQPYLARLGADGVVDTAFAPQIDDGVNALARQADGKIVIAGYFSHVGGQVQRYLARLNADGSLDAGFAPTLDVAATLLTVQADGRIVVGGFFNQVNGQPRRYLARLNADGSLDDGFAPDPDWRPEALLQQNDGKLLLGGPFFHLYGERRPWLARFNVDGSTDQTFPIFDSDVNNIVTIRAFAQQADGKLLIGGALGGIDNEEHANVARLNADGSLDRSFDTQVEVLLGLFAVTLQTDGSVWLGGDLSAVDGQPHAYLARVAPTQAALQSLDLAAASTQVQWHRAATAPDLVRADFALSPDGLAWSELGRGLPTANGWTLSDLSLPRNQPLWLRAIGHAMSGAAAGSESLYESVRMLYLPGFNAIAQAGAGGRVDPPSRGVDAGATASFTLTPDPGYQIDRIGGSCGGTLVGSTFTTAPVQADCTVEAMFVSGTERIFADGFEAR